MKIAIYGLGYVGLTASACLAKAGHDITGVDISDDKVRQINSGISPIVEPGLSELLVDAIGKGLLRCTTDATGPARECDMVIVCVGTPSGSDGAHNMNAIAEVTRQIAYALDGERREPLTVVYRSTVRPGTMQGLIRPIFQAAVGPESRAYELVYNPEFLRESTAIKDFFNPPRIVVGTVDGRTSERMDEMHKELSAPVFYTKFRESELTKFMDNTFHALKVAFANEIGRICQSLELDTYEVYRIFVADTKLNISANYLRPGGPFGGSCLPKDVRALQYISGEIGANTPVIDAVLRSNEAHKHHIFKKCTKDLPVGSSVLLLGLAFKANSDDLRESPNVYLARKFIESGYRLSVYDPYLRPKMLKGQNLGYAYLHLPTINELLVTRETAEESHFDLVVDANKIAPMLSLRSARVIDLSSTQ